jgi:UPF0716 protein FxsA
LFVLFILVPLLEVYILVKVGGVIGALPTIALVVLTAVAGAALLRQQGLATVRRVQQSLDRGEAPARELVGGLFLLLGGALLLTPGFFTDLFGFMCLLPGTRDWMATRLLEQLLQRGTVHVAARQQRGPGHVIDGEYSRDD